jgi:hypothetical protein
MEKWCDNLRFPGPCLLTSCALQVGVNIDYQSPLQYQWPIFPQATSTAYLGPSLERGYMKRKCSPLSRLKRSLRTAINDLIASYISML